MHVQAAPQILDSRRKNGHGLGAIFHQPGRERRTPSDGVPLYKVIKEDCEL